MCPHPCQKLVLLLTASVEWSTTGPYLINRQLVLERPYKESLLLMTTSQERGQERGHREVDVRLAAKHKERLLM